MLRLVVSIIYVLILMCWNISLAFSSERMDVGMDSYYNWALSCLDRLGKDLPAIAKSADIAAKHFVMDDYMLGTWGDDAFVREFHGRAGGIMRIDNPKATDKGFGKEIILVCPRQDHIQKDIAQAAKMKQQDNMVILFARPAVAKIAEEHGVAFDAVINTHAAENGGLYNLGDKWMVPTDSVANLAALWVWTAEFVSGCTRYGKMPTMWQSYSVPTAVGRQKKFQHIKFHDEKPVPVPAGNAGREYISKVVNILNLIYSSDRGKMLDVAKQAANAALNGNNAYIKLLGHAIELKSQETSNPYSFIQIVDQKNPGFRKGDFLFCVGYDQKYQDEQFGDLTRAARKAAAAVSWSISTYNAEKVDGVLPGEILIDQRWPLGDCVVQYPGYDIKVLPPSGVIGETIRWMVTSQVFRQMTEQK